MRRNHLVWALGAAALVLALGAGPARAGKSGGFSSGGRSFSAPSGKSYASGGGGRSSFSTPAGRSYASGGARPSSTPAPARGYSSGASPARTPSGFTPSPARPSTATTGGPVSTPSPSGKSYASGGNASPGRTAPAGNGRPPTGYASPSGKSYLPGARTTTAGGGFDAGAAAAQRREVSRAEYTKGKSPAPSYTVGKDKTLPVDPKDGRIQELRDQLDHERWVNRAQREQDFYRNYWTRPAPVVVYNDPYNHYFWWWLLDQDAQTRALWYYNHRQVVDDARYGELRAHDAQLEALLRQLEAQGVVPDPAAVPPGVPPDLVYSDSYVTAAYNPQPASAWHALRVLLFIVAVLGLLVVLIWLVFFKRWGGAPR